MFDARKVQRDFSHASAQYDAHAHLQQRVRSHALKLAQAQWQAQARVLDIGSGTGSFAADGESWQSVALDLSYEMCRMAQGRGGMSVNADAGALPFADHVFDGVFSSLMLQWVNEPKRVLEEIARVIKPSATAVLATLTSGSLPELHHAFVTIDSFPHISHFHTVDNWCGWANEAGFSIEHAAPQTIVDYYADTKALMRSLRIIGANNKRQERRKSVMTPRQFARMDSVYRDGFATEQGLPATWRILYLVLRRNE